MLAIPPKRTDRAIVTFLTDGGIEAVLAALTGTSGSDAATTPSSPLAIQTGLRVSELVGLACGDVSNMARPDFAEFARLVQVHRVTRAEVVPPLVLARHPLVDESSTCRAWRS